VGGNRQHQPSDQDADRLLTVRNGARNPTALVASIGNAALSGCLVKQGATIEAMAGVDTVLFDKTGTLTTGRPRVTSIQPLNGLGELDLLPLAATAEKFSERPMRMRSSTPPTSR